jgi:hypothetical protein
MPPRHSARVVGVAERDARSARVVAAAEHAAPALAPLPPALVLHILSLLPVDARLRCAEVCRSWRAALEDTSLWIRLDLSASGVSPNCAVTGALLHAAAARARGELVALDLRGCKRVTFRALLAAATANSALRELRIHGLWGCRARSESLETDELEALLRAAPRLDVYEADVWCCELALARRLLRNEPPFKSLHVHSFEFQHAEDERDEASVLALAVDIGSHAHLRRLKLTSAPLSIRYTAALNAVVDAALARRLTSVTLRGCSLSPESVPALVRLVGGGAMAELYISGLRQLLDVPSALALGNALRLSSTLTAVSLPMVRLWRARGAGAALLRALAGHPSLRSLDISINRSDWAGREEAGAVLAALVAANAPALQEIRVQDCNLGDAGLGPLFHALPANTHLTTLTCSDNELSDVFVRDALLPAVRANTSLRELDTGLDTDVALIAEALVRRRADAA